MKLKLRNYQVEALKEHQDRYKGWTTLNSLDVQASPIVSKVSRYVVYCWSDIKAYAHQSTPEAVCTVLASTPELAQDAVRAAALGHYEAFEVHPDSHDPRAAELGMTFEEFRDFHLDRIKTK